MKSHTQVITTALLIAIALTVGSALSPGLTSSARAADEPHEKYNAHGLNGWDKVEYDINGIPPASIDAYAAQELARKNGCFRCHAIDRVKTGPAFTSVAEAYKDDLKGGEEREYDHLTAGDVFVLNGKVDHHRVLETTPPNDSAQLKNLIFWIFSLK
jgi:cytochrome c